MTDPLYIIAQQVTDEVLGQGTYAEINKGNPDPGVQAAIEFMVPREIGEEDWDLFVGLPFVEPNWEERITLVEKASPEDKLREQLTKVWDMRRGKSPADLTELQNVGKTTLELLVDVIYQKAKELGVVEEDDINEEPSNLKYIPTTQILGDPAVLRISLGHDRYAELSKEEVADFIASLAGLWKRM